MGKQTVVQGKVQDQGNGKFKIEKGNGPNEVDIEIDLGGDGNYEVEKLSVDGLPTNVSSSDSTPIRWFNNFSIKKDGQYINQKYNVTIPGLLNLLGKSKLVIYSEMHDPNLYDYGAITSDTFELTDGDPGTGGVP
jgi:hypothetical protein